MSQTQRWAIVVAELVMVYQPYLRFFSSHIVSELDWLSFSQVLSGSSISFLAANFHPVEKKSSNVNVLTNFLSYWEPGFILRQF